MKGSCNIERINQISDGDMIAVDQTGYLQISGWNLVAGQEMTAETVSYLTLLSMDGEQAFTAQSSSAFLGPTWLNTTSCRQIRDCGLESARPCD